jgi:hypothetical protein
VVTRACAAISSAPVARTGNAGDEAGYERADDVGHGLQLERRRIGVSLGEHLDEEREGERMAVRELQHPRVQLTTDAGAAQQLATVLGPEVAQ